MNLICRIAFGTLLALPFAGFAQPHVTAIHNARIFDGSGKPAYVGTVVITGDRITSVETGDAVPAGAEVIDAAGKTLLPGFFDVHTHLNASAGALTADWQKSTAAYLICGVTTIDEFSANREMYEPLRKLMADGTVQAPHINFATRISTPGGHGAESGMGEFTTIEVSTAAAAHQVMKQVIPYKPDVIKIFTDGWRYGKIPDLSSMNEQTIHAIVVDAHKANMKVLTHTLTVAGAKTASRAGVDIIAHSIQDGRVDQELINIMKKNGTAYAPTMAVFEGDKPRVATPLELSVLEPKQRAELSETVANKKPLPPNDPALDHWYQLQENLRILYSAGIPVALGTDNGMPSTPHGWGSLREMELMVGAGLTPSQALQAGTLVSAKALAVDKDRGSIAPGKLADLVLVDGRPDESIGDVEKTDTVWLAGRLVDRKKLLSYFDSEKQVRLPVASIPAELDTMELLDGRTNIGTYKYPTTDPGADHSKIIMEPITRDAKSHAWLVTAKFGPEEKNYVRLNVPLTPGEITLADLSKYKGVSFDIKGEGSFRFLMNTYDVRDRKLPFATFSVSPDWKTVKILFSDLSPETTGPADIKEARGLIFEETGLAGANAWMQIDSIRLF